jgi:cytochrome c-type biogenesis protein CcmH
MNLFLSLRGAHRATKQSRSAERQVGRRLPRRLKAARNDTVMAILALITLFCLAIPAQAVRPDEMLADPKLEARARDIGKDLRCLVCRNQSIDDSDADLAHDLRVLVRQRLTAGDTDQQVIAYIVSRYGDYVLLKPPFEVATWLLWGGPAIILLVGLWGISRYMRRQSGLAGPPPLSADEERRLAAMLEQKAEPSGTKTT